MQGNKYIRMPERRLRLKSTNKYEVIDLSCFSSVQVALQANGATGTLKFWTSIDSENEPDVTAATSATNTYDTTVVQTIKDEDVIEGDTGIAFATTTGCTNYRINADFVPYLVIGSSDLSAGTIDVVVSAIRE